jgi:hypothetical protein
VEVAGLGLSCMLIALVLLATLSAQQVHAAANFTNSSPNQMVKVLIEKAIISIKNGQAQDVLSNLTLADRLLGGSIYSEAPQFSR